jgi:hypothetical protein
MDNRVLAVVSNFRRPENVALVCSALKSQPCDIIVADNGKWPADDGFRDDWKMAGARDIWSWTQNSGPPARWYPALAWTHKYDYIMLVDDDHLPSDGLVESLVAQAESLDNHFAVIGRIGRNYRYRQGRWSYRKRNVREGQVDMAGAGYFVVAHFLHQVIPFRNVLADAGAHPDMLWHDDIILNCAIQMLFRRPSCMPTQPWAAKRLDTQGYAFSATSAYQDVRDDLINLCARCGWRRVRWEEE